MNISVCTSHLLFSVTMESLNIKVIYFLICMSSTILQVNSHVLNLENFKNNLKSGLESNNLVSVNQNLNSENVNRVKKSPVSIANSPYTTTICVQVRPDNSTSQQYEGNQNLSQQASPHSENIMLDQHFEARVAQKKPSEDYQMNAVEKPGMMPMYFNPSRQRMQAPQVMQIPSSFLNSQHMREMIQTNLQPRKKEAEQRLHAGTDHFNPHITDNQLTGIKPMLVQVDHQQDEMIQQSNLDKSTRLMGNQYYRTYDIPDKEIGTAQYQIPFQVLPSSPLTVTKQYVLSSYPRKANTGGHAEFITSNVPLTLNCDVSPGSTSKEAVKLAQYTIPRQNKGHYNVYPTRYRQEINQIFPFLQNTYSQQQIKHMRFGVNNPWAKQSQKTDLDSVVYKGEPTSEQVSEPKVIMDELGRSIMYWKDPSQMFTPIYKYGGLNEERKSNEGDNQFPQSQEKIMNTLNTKQTITNGRDWTVVQPVRALTEEELKIKEKNIEEQLKESQTRLEELQKQLKESKTISKDSNESETEETRKPNESSTIVPASTTKTPSGSMKTSVPRKRNTK